MRLPLALGIMAGWLVTICAAGNLLAATAEPPVLKAVSGTGLAVRHEAKAGDFPLAQDSRPAPVWVDESDSPVAKLAANLLADDIERVCGVKPAVELLHGAQTPATVSEHIVVIGTVGKSASLIDALISNKKLDVAPIQGKWESFIIKTVANPFPGVKSALVIAGSDRRGTAYGVFTVSEAIGVSPWYWWAEVTPEKHHALFIEPVLLVQGSPSVKYRGIFINDEWNFRRWSCRTFEKGSSGNKIGPKTYAKVFELLLRLKANFLWPAMCDRDFFNWNEENKRVADQYGIVIGSTHCEQMLFNNEAEWDSKKNGPWNYFSNGEKILAAWEKRLQENGRFENVYTTGLRGIADRGMEGGKSIQDQVGMMEKIFADQRALISKHVNPDVTAVPKIFVPYREVMPLYRAGLKVPEDITLLWCDNNYGYMRQLSTPAEQKRAGGSGVYYHLGFSHYNGWLSLFSPSQIAYELHKAYQYGADRIWVIHGGDIKPKEKEITFAMQMAWDITRWTPENADDFIGEWATTTFGAEFAPEIARIMRSWYRLAARGNPSVVHMGMGGVFSPGEASERLAAFEQIGQAAEAIEPRLPSRLRDAYLHLVLYPVKALGLFEEEVGLARKSLSLACSGNPNALEVAGKSKEAAGELRKLNGRYDNSAGGKWRGMAGNPPGGFPGARLQPLATEELLEKGRNGAGVPLVMESLPEPLLRIQAKDYSGKSTAGPGRIATCPGFGFSDGLTLLPVTLPPVDEKNIQDAPWVEYDLDLPAGELTLQFRALPTHRIHEGRSLRFAVSLGGREPKCLDVQADEGYNAWWQNVHRGYSHREVDYPADAPRHAKLRLYLLEPGVVLQDILIHKAWKRSLPADALDAANVDDDLSWDAALEAKRKTHTLEGLYSSHRLNPAIFHWPVKVDPTRPNRLVCTVWGDDSRTLEVFINDVQIARENLVGNQPGRFMDLKLTIPEHLTKGKETVEVKVRSSGFFTYRGKVKSGVLNGVFACQAEPVP